MTVMIFVTLWLICKAQYNRSLFKINTNGRFCMNRSITPNKKPANNKSRTPNSHQRSSATKSPSKADPLSQVDIGEKLKKNREKLTHTLDTYTILIRSNNPIRCLEHNSVVSVFCETENRLLCTNCIFGKNQHKFHKIFPVDKSYEKIREGIQKIKPHVENEIRAISNIKQVIMHGLEKQIIDMERGLDEITKKYNEVHQLIEDNYIRLKGKLVQTLQAVRVRHETVAVQLNFLQDIYNVKMPLINLDFSTLTETQILPYHHSLLQVINSQKKFTGNVWNTPKYQMKQIVAEQIRKISRIREDLLAWLSKQL